jgi:hypothetical protein
MQGKNGIILTCTDKVNSFKEKLTLWGARMKKENKVEMFVDKKLQTGQKS